MALLDAGLETLICSLDGVKAETHESIRIGAVFEEVVSNITRFLKLRAERNGRTRVVIRFTAQKNEY